MLSEVVKKTNDVKIDTVIKNLEKRGIKAQKADSAREALMLALSFVKPGDTVAFGGSATINEMCLITAEQKALKKQKLQGQEPFYRMSIS